MFETIEQPGVARRALCPILMFSGQFILVYPIALLPAWPVLTISKPQGASHHYLIDAGIMLIGGFLLGLTSGRLWPWITRTGRWLWILPVSWLAAQVTQDIFHPPAISCAPIEAFCSSLDVFFVTLPAFCYSGYSIGMLIARRWIIGTAVRKSGSGSLPVVDGQGQAGRAD